MKFIQPFLLLSFLFTFSLWSTTPVPYSGKIDIGRVNYDGDAQFLFSLQDENGTTHWRNGNQPKETIKVSIRNGRYSVLLGGQGMNSLPPELFLNHDKLYLKVEFDNEDGEGLRHLAPDQLITATPRALVADIAKVAQVAEKVGNGAITRDMLSSEVLAKLDANGSSSTIGSITRDMLPTSVLNDLNKTIVITREMLPQDVRDDLNKSIVITRDMLPASVLNDLNKSVIITREMLPKDVRDDLNKTVTITRNMLPADVLSDLNRTISKSMLGSDVLADLNKSSSTATPITLSMLAPEVTAKLDQNGSGGNTTVNNPPAVGSLIALPYGQNAPAGYSLYQQGKPKELVWEEKAPVSVARFAFDGVEVLNGKIYFVGGKDGSSAKNIAERYDPVNNTWETLSPMSVARGGIASAVLNGKLYVIGGQGLSSVEVFDQNTGYWSAGVALPSVLYNGTAITANGKIYIAGGTNASGQNINQVLSFDPSTNQWTAQANMSTAKDGLKLVWFKDRIWAVGGKTNGSITNIVESYDPNTDTWQTEVSTTTNRHWHVAWVANGRIYIGGGWEYINSTESYDPATKQWSSAGNIPENRYAADAVVLNDKAYVIAGKRAADVFSNKVYAADLNASVDGVYDLYRKDGNASAGTPLVQAEVVDGSVTASKMANNTITTSQLNEQILKYLKPEITTQPQAQTVYADTNASFSVTAEGKYLSYQWKKYDSNLTGETNATLTITDANATQDDGNYSVVVSNDFGSVESNEVLLDVNTSLLDGLVGWWKFDETNGTIAYDFSGNGNDGNLTNGPTWTIGKIGGALSFDGVDDRVKIPHTILDQKLAFTVSLWFNMKMGSDSSYHAFITAANSSNANAFTFEKRPDHNMMIRDMGEDSISAAKTSDFWTSTWRHVTLAKSSLGIVFYLSGEELYSKNYSTATTSVDANGLWIGPDQDSVGGGWQSGQSVKGELDDYRIYDRALSAAEVQALYNLGQ
jgi:N-acetylneuraminic acid mutarotase